MIAPYKALLEGWYLRHQSFVVDLKLIVLTLAAVLRLDLDPSAWLDDLPDAPETLTSLRSA